MTISGVTSETYNPLATHSEFRFHRAYAAKVPISVARRVDTTAMVRLFAAASSNSRLSSMALYQRSERPSHAVKREPFTLKIARISSGKCRNA